MGGKHRSTGISIPQCHPGCMWGILHVLKYQRWHWRSIKKRLPHKKHDAEAENPGDDVQASNTDDSSTYMKAEVANCKVEGKKRQSSSGTRSSVRSRLKALVTEDMSRRKGRGWHHRSSIRPARSQLAGTASTHHAEARESPKVADENNKISSDSSSEDQVLPKSSEELITSDENDEGYGIMFSRNDSSHDRLDEIENATSCQEDLNHKKQAFLKQKAITSKELNKNDSACESKYLMDALDIININKGFLQTILQDPGSPLAHYFHKQQAISDKLGLAKSETFPTPGSSSRRGSGQHRQKQKQDATQFHAKEMESNVRFHRQKSLDHESMEDIRGKSMSLTAADHRADGIHQLNQVKSEMADISSSSSSYYMKQSGGNQVAKRRFKYLKQNIKQAIKESEKERHRIAMDAVLHKIPHRKGFSKDLADDLVDCFKNLSRIKDVSSEIFTSKRRMQHHRRSSSFSESMDRYTRLYESNFNREAEEHISKRIQERREEEKVLPCQSAKKSLGRILSSPELHSYHSEDYSSDAFSSDMPTTVANSTLSLSSLNEQKFLDVSEALDYRSQETLGKSGTEENLIDFRETFPLSADQLALNSSTNSKTIGQVGKSSDESRNLMIWDDVSQSEQHDKPGIVPIKKMKESSSIPLLNITLEKQTANPTEIAILQDMELKESQGLATEPELPDDAQHKLRDNSKVAEGIVEFEKVDGLKDLDNDLLQDQVGTNEKDKFTYVRNVLELSGFMGDEALDTLLHSDEQPLDPLVAEGIVEFEKVDGLKDLDNDLLQDQVGTNEKDKFTYVRNVLELSGFMGDEALDTLLHSDEQPLDPLVYEVVRGCSFCDPHCSGDEEVGYCNHPLLFDLINEVLMELYERSYSYNPRLLSSLCQISRMPGGRQLLEEVWANISWYLSYESEFDKPLDFVANKDLTRSDGWMNLQFENECMGLELEELIFDDLLEELICT